MMRIEEIDTNFSVGCSAADMANMRFFDVTESMFDVYGVYYEGDKFVRMPSAVSYMVNEGVFALHGNTAGGRAVFTTDSRRIAICAKMSSIGKMPHFTLCGCAGFDMYSKKNGKYVYEKTFVPPLNIKDGYTSFHDTKQNEKTEYTVNFPLYSNVNKLFIGIDETAKLYENNTKLGLPIVYYGSSITQGGCASRPGNSYQSIVSRIIDSNFINLGFSGSARGELAIAEYISKLDMRAFVYDYDHNAPTIEHLQNTHKRMFDLIRGEKPDLPIVIMSRPQIYPTEVEKIMSGVVYKTYTDAIESGDKNVCFIDGSKVMIPFANDSGTVDMCHPNDLGFMCMAHAVAESLVALGVK